MEEHGVHPKALEYMKKNKLGMFSAADKKLVKENTPPSEVANKKKEMAKKMQVKHEGRDMYFQKTTKRGETRLHAK